MGVFDAFFGCIGDDGFNGCCSRASSGDGGFMVACISGCRGVIGFNHVMSLRPVREIVRPARLDVGASAKKFSLQAQNGRKTLFLGVLGELFRGWASGSPVPGELFRGNAGGGAALGELFRGSAGERLCWASLWFLDLRLTPAPRCRARVDAALVPPLDLGCATDPRSRAQDLRYASRRGHPKEPQVGAS